MFVNLDASVVQFLLISHFLNDVGIGHFDDWMDDVLKDKDVFDEKDQTSLKKEQKRHIHFVLTLH